MLSILDRPVDLQTVYVILGESFARFAAMKLTCFSIVNHAIDLRYSKVGKLSWTVGSRYGYAYLQMYDTRLTLSKNNF